MGFGWARRGGGGSSRRPRRLPVTRVALVGGSEAPSLHLLPQSEACGLADLVFSQQWTAVWCGMGTGIAGYIVDRLLDAGGSAQAVLVRGREPSYVHRRASCSYVETFHERTAALFQTDAVIVVPGGAGTMAELALFSAWKQAGLWTGPIVVLDPSDWFRPFRTFAEQCAERQVARQLEDHVRFVTSYAEVPEALGVRKAAKRSPTDFLLHVCCVEEAPEGLPAHVSGLMRPVGANAPFFCTPELRPTDIRRLAIKSDWWGLFGGANAFVEPSVTASALVRSALALAAGAPEERRGEVERAWTAVSSVPLPPLPPHTKIPPDLAGVGLARFAILLGASRDAATAERVLAVFEPLVKAAGVEIDAARTMIAVHRMEHDDAGTRESWLVFRTAIRRLLGLVAPEGPPQPWETAGPAADFFAEFAHSRRTTSDDAYVKTVASVSLTPFDASVGIVAGVALRSYSPVAKRAQQQLVEWLSDEGTIQRIGASARELLRTILLPSSHSPTSDERALRVLDALSSSASLAYAASVCFGHAASSCWLMAFARAPLTAACLYPGAARDNDARLVGLVPFWDAAFRVGHFIKDHPGAPAEVPPDPEAVCGWDSDHPAASSLGWFWEWASQGNARLTAELQRPHGGERTNLEDAALLGICLGGSDASLKQLAYSQLSSTIKATLPYVRPDTFDKPLLEVTRQRLAVGGPSAAQILTLAAALALVIDARYVSATSLHGALDALLDKPARPTIPFVFLERVAPALRGSAAYQIRLLARCGEPVTIAQQGMAEAIGSHGTRVAPALARGGHPENVGGSVTIGGGRYGFFVDRECILCGVCSDAAPKNFRMSADETQSICFKQPIDDSELHACVEAENNCPVNAVRRDGF